MSCEHEKLAKIWETSAVKSASACHVATMAFGEMLGLVQRAVDTGGIPADDLQLCKARALVGAFRELLADLDDGGSRVNLVKLEVTPVAARS